MANHAMIRVPQGFQTVIYHKKAEAPVYYQLKILVSSYYLKNNSHI